MQNNRIPFVDIKPARSDPRRAEILAEIEAVIDRGAFAGGEFVAAFEADFAAFCGTSRALGVANGTEALALALRAVGVVPGDEVITVPNTFIATAEAISLCGARPVFVDIDERTHTLDPKLLEPAITRRTKAVIPVHLYGQMADMDPIMEIARRRGLRVIEDACQAHGAEYKGRRAGSIGDAGCFSFYPTKNLGAWGEAGAVVTNDNAVADKVALLRDHGQDRKYHHLEIGGNGRMDGIQAAVLRTKLRHLQSGNELRRARARLYSERLADTPEVRVEAASAHGLPVYHLYVVRVAGRDRVLSAMAQRGIACAVHYPFPIHLQPAYRQLGLAAGALPVAERCAEEILSLPLYPELSPAQVETVAGELASVVCSDNTAPAFRA